MTTEKQNKILNKKSFDILFIYGIFCSIVTIILAIMFLYFWSEAKNENDRNNVKANIYKVGKFFAILTSVVIICIIVITICTIAKII